MLNTMSAARRAAPKLRPMRALLVVASVSLLGMGQGLAQTQPAQDGSTAPAMPQMRSLTNAQRRAAAARTAAKKRASAPASTTGAQSPKARVTRQAAVTSSVFATPAPPDYFGSPSWGFSPIIPKFVDALPGVGAANASATLGTYIPIAVADTTTFPGSDYYTIELDEYQQKLHSSLGPTTLRGYKDVNGATAADRENHYLGPLIVAQRGRPVRVKFINSLPTGTTGGLTGNGGNLFIPVDTTYMGAGMALDGNKFTQNRADLHLHGGNTPWISDGTPHQWITPAGETGTSTANLKGVSFQNVPDMVGPGRPIVSPAPGDGMSTSYWTNQESARLLFYHDHALGMTRLNVYAGEAAGYLIHDSTEDGLIAAGTLPNQGGGVYNWGIPLIIQDKTFVDPTTITATDPTWVWLNSQGSLWFPHVYVPNQNPADISGANGVGRWDYGMWFWPPLQANQIAHADVSCLSLGLTAYPATTRCPGTPNPSGVPEAFMDTPLVNGAAYPYLPVGRQAYRFRILNAANDRSMNLQLYYAATAAGVVCKGNAQPASACTEVSLVPAIPHKKTGTSNTFDGLIQCAATAIPDPVTGIPAACWPANWPTDGRDGGVPDPLTAGPQLYQIGTESGLLPNVVPVPSQPVGYEYNRRSITVLNVFYKALYLMPAERADAIVDFSSVPEGSTLILYNDAPAPVPAFDTRNDYYTGDPDQSLATGDGTGGAPTTLAGFGPNTRTVMQFRVSGGTGVAFNVAALQTALPTAYAASQAAPVVPEAVFNTAYGATYPNTYSRIQDTSLTFTDVGGTTPTAHPMQPKAIQELFELNYGRMNATLGVELPFTNFNTQTTIPYGYIDPPTEILQTATPQIWKITHNGVDTHGIHFHLFDVQVVNRVGWDGAVKPPDANEVGWKDTVRMNPLEDVIVALRPMGQSLPWPIPDSVRTLDPTIPENATDIGFSGLAPDNQPIAGMKNFKMNFGQEYVWHCHILGHEENDMMRAMVYQTPVEGPTGLTAAQTTATQVTLHFADHSASETGFLLERSTDNSTFATPTAIALAPNPAVITGPAGVTTTAVDNTVAVGHTYYYRVSSIKNNVYDGVAATGLLTAPVTAADPRTQSAPSAPTSVAVINPLASPVIVRSNGTGTSPNLSVGLVWTGPAGATFTVQRDTTTAFSAPVALCTTTGVTCTNSAVSAGSYYYRVGTVNPSPAPPSWSAPVFVGPPAAPTSLTAILSGTTGVRLTWTDNSPSLPNPPNFNAETGFTVQRTNPDTSITSIAALSHAGTGATVYTNTPVSAGQYQYQVRATNAFGSSGWSNSVTITR